MLPHHSGSGVPSNSVDGSKAGEDKGPPTGFSAVAYPGQFECAGKERAPWLRHRKAAGMKAAVCLQKASGVRPGDPHRGCGGETLRSSHGTERPAPPAALPLPPALVRLLEGTCRGSWYRAGAQAGAPLWAPAPLNWVALSNPVSSPILSFSV